MGDGPSCLPVWALQGETVSRNRGGVVNGVGNSPIDVSFWLMGSEGVTGGILTDGRVGISLTQWSIVGLYRCGEAFGRTGDVAMIGSSF